MDFRIAHVGGLGLQLKTTLDSLLYQSKKYQTMRSNIHDDGSTFQVRLSKHEKEKKNVFQLPQHSNEDEKENGVWSALDEGFVSTSLQRRTTQEKDLKYPQAKEQATSYRRRMSNRRYSDISPDTRELLLDNAETLFRELDASGRTSTVDDDASLEEDFEVDDCQHDLYRY